MKMKRIAVGIVTASMMLTACNVKKSEDAQTAVIEPATQGSDSAKSEPTASPSGVSPIFNIDSLPISTAALGEFPYFTIPAGYTTDDMDGSTLDFARYPFFVKGKNVMVEGKFYQTGVKATAGKAFSPHELASNFDNAIKQMGGVKVSEMRVPDDFRREWPEDVKDAFPYPTSLQRFSPAHIWVIRRNDGNIWVLLSADEKKGGYIVGKEQSMTATSSLLPAASLKQAIASQGRVDVQVNFATDKTEILPSSMPQIDQVYQLLSDDPALKLSINGHTDSTGTPAHNQTLSEGRAKSVVSTLSSKGINAQRMVAKGFGATRPVADNNTEEGKAKNRRVELVKI